MDDHDPIPYPEGFVQTILPHIRLRTGCTKHPDPTAHGQATNAPSIGFARASASHVEPLQPGDVNEACVRAAIRRLMFWRTVLERGAEKVYIGGWPDAKSVDYLLSLTAVVQCPREARRLAEAQSQEYVFDLAGQRDIPVAELPK